MSFHPHRFKKKSSEETIRAKKSLGQNFLVDRSVVGKIIDLCSLTKEDTVLEIGPGTGALTREIASRVKRVIAVETDRVLAGRLQDEFKQRHIEVHQGDFLKCNLSKIISSKSPVKVIGNLPYNISTPIITTIIENRSLFSDFYLTIQKELGERLVANSGSKDYGSFSCYVQFYTQAQILLKIKPTAFKPVPKVDSVFMRLALRENPAMSCIDERFLFQVIRLGFGQRRKTLLNALSTLVPKEQLTAILVSMNINPLIRAEQISLQQYGTLADKLYTEISDEHK